MKSIFFLILYKIFYNFISLRFKMMNKILRIYNNEVYFYCYNKAMIVVEKLFPNSDLKFKKDLAYSYINVLLYKWTEKKNNVELLNLRKIESEVKKDKNFLNRISEYHLVEAFRLKIINLTTLNTRIKYELKMARLFLKNRRKIKSLSKVIELTNQLKDVNKDLIKVVRQNVKKDIKKEKDKLFQKININADNVILLISLFSTLFLLSGLVNIKFFYYLLDFNTNIFFNLSDYLSGSIYIIISVTNSIILGAIIFIFKLIGD